LICLGERQLWHDTSGSPGHAGSMKIVYAQINNIPTS